MTAGALGDGAFLSPLALSVPFGHLDGASRGRSLNLGPGTREALGVR
jgi:hypothetical protein